MHQHARPGFSLQLLKLVLFIMTVLFVLLIWGALTDTQAQKRSTRPTAVKTEAPAEEIEKPLYREYKGISIGMSADEVRGKLGEPQEKSDAQDFYVFSEQETAQFYYDNAKKLKAVSIDYVGGSSAPDCKTVVGAEIEAKADGSMYKLVRYQSAGYWVSCNRTANPSPIITVTMQRIAP